MKTHFIVIACLLLTSLSGCDLVSGSRPRGLPGLPEITPHPTIDPLSLPSEFLTGVRVDSYDPLNNVFGWTVHDPTAALINGVFELRGTPGWQSSFWPRRQFQDGQGLMVRFEVQNANARSELVVVTGQWMTDSFRQFGVYNAVTPKGDLFQGTLDLGGYDLQSSLSLLGGTWYDLLLAIGRNGRFLAVIWDPDHPDRRATYDLAAGPAWAGRSWVFLPKVNEGETLGIDDFYRISFDAIK